jgi:thioredoxin 1
MASENVVELTDANFDEQVLQSDKPVLVDLWAEWCGPCRMLAPTVDELADEYAGKAVVGKLDTDGNRQTAMQYNISAIPTLLVFKGGQLVKKLVGMQNKKDIKAVLDEQLQS